MRIAQVSPLFERVPPKRYGGTERVVSYLTEELISRGHEVTLFASGDSVTRARLISSCEKPLRGSPVFEDSLIYHFILLEQLRRHSDEFDLIHFHIDYVHFPMTRLLDWEGVTTLHGRLNIPSLAPLYREFSEMRVISISQAQRSALPWLSWLGTVHHGLPLDLYHFQEKPGRYLSFVGRISPEKGLDRAIEIAGRVGLPLRVAAKVDPVNEPYYNEVIRPLLLRSPHVEFLGEISDWEKQELLGNSLAMLFPIDWPEPFGLVLIEAMACGTPTVAFSRGSVPEVLEQGVTGFMAQDVESAVAAVLQVERLSRARCRSVFEARFSAPVMADGYLRLYASLLSDGGETLVGATNGRDHSAEGSVLRTGQLFAG